MNHLLCKAKRRGYNEWVTGFYFEIRDSYDHKRVSEALIMVNAHEQIVKQEPIAPGQPRPRSKHYSRSEIGVDCFRVDHDTVCRATGTRTPYGRPVWEWDICRFIVELECGLAAEYIGVVRWSGTGFKLWHSPGTEYYSDLHAVDLSEILSRSIEFEIIGNTHDNPELLKPNQLAAH